MLELLEFGFMQNALLAAILVGIACGIVGTFIVTKRIVFISGGITHAAFGGIGLGYLIGINPVLAAIPFSLASALGIGLLSKKVRVNEDSAIGILWAVGMALGVLFIGIAPGYAPDLFSYLFGSILTVPSADLFTMLALDVVIVASVLLLFKELVAVSFDEEFAQIVGIPSRLLYLLLLCLVALSIVVLIRVAGVILVMALLTIPAAIARQFTDRMGRLMVLSTMIAVLFTGLGLYLSYVFDVASGATIVLTLAAAFFVSLGFHRHHAHRG